MSRAGGTVLKKGAYYIQAMSNGDVFFAKIDRWLINGNYKAGMVDCYVGKKPSRVKQSRINNTSLWKPVESLPEAVHAIFDAFYKG
jgi:hypothetical protein